MSFQFFSKDCHESHVTALRTYCISLFFFFFSIINFLIKKAHTHTQVFIIIINFPYTYLFPSVTLRQEQFSQHSSDSIILILTISMVPRLFAAKAWLYLLWLAKGHCNRWLILQAKKSTGLLKHSTDYPEVLLQLENHCVNWNSKHWQNISVQRGQMQTSYFGWQLWFKPSKRSAKMHLHIVMLLKMIKYNLKCQMTIYGYNM